MILEGVDVMKLLLRIILAILLATMISLVYSWYTRPYEIWKPLDKLNSEDLVKGSLEMKRHKVAIVGIVRDCISELPAMKRYIEYTGGFFDDYRVVIFENDSTDGTKWFLSKWSNHNEKVKILTHDYGNQKRPSIDFLGACRNQYIDELKNNPEYKDFDIVMIVDMDMPYGWDMRGVFDSFSKIDKWDVACSNGVRTWDSDMADLFAFRVGGLSSNTTTYPAGGPLVPVTSCFGGMAFYKKYFTKGCRYIANGDCEHVSFNSCAIENGARIVMNPSQILRYTENPGPGRWYGIYGNKNLKTWSYKIRQKVRYIKDKIFFALDIIIGK